MEKTLQCEINGVIYNAFEGQQINKGDLVVDKRDMTYGYCSSSFKGSDGIYYIAIKQGDVVEIGIPMTRVYKLIPALENNSKN